MKNVTVSLPISIAVLTLLLAVIAVVFFSAAGPSPESIYYDNIPSSRKDRPLKKETQSAEGTSSELTFGQMRAYDRSAVLHNVASGIASGFVLSRTNVDGEFELRGEFKNLVDPESIGSGYFYEGWIVRTEPFAVVGVGAFDVLDGVGFNNFTSNTDYSDYDQYVLTIEPNDGNPAPADHVLEGEFARN